MGLNLIDCRAQGIEMNQVYKLAGHEVGHSDGTHETVGNGLFQVAPRSVYIVVWPVKKHQVEIIGWEFFQGLFQTFATVTVGKAGEPDLGG